MIYDALQNAGSYHSLSPRIGVALRFLVLPESRTLGLGKHSIDGEEIFALVQEYNTQPASERFWECHRRYIDIQFVVSGIERIGIAPVEQLKVVEAYDPARDFIKLEGDGQFIDVSAGSFAIFMPQDAHMPCVAAGAPERVRKIVMKVAM